MNTTLPKTIIEELRSKAEYIGVSVEEYLLDVLTKDYDSKNAAEKYLSTAMELLKQAREELEKDDLKQASEEIWSTCALAIKAHALARKGKRIESHAELWIYKNEVAKEISSWIRAVFRQADSMHKNFYEGFATREDVEDTLKEVEKLVNAIVQALRKYE